MNSKNLNFDNCDTHTHVQREREREVVLGHVQEGHFYTTGATLSQKNLAIWEHHLSLVDEKRHHRCIHAQTPQ